MAHRTDSAPEEHSPEPSAAAIAPTERLTAIDVFSGAGGMSLGFEQAGFDVLAAVDLDPVHLSAHQYNFPQCEVVCGDAGSLTGDSLVAAARRGWNTRNPEIGFAGSVDCVFGGPSCQGFSVIGSRDPDDPRNALVFDFARIVGEVRPRWFVLENVPGLVSPAYRRVLGSLRKRFQDMGYQVGEPWRLNARRHGVPQDRTRIFVVGARAGVASPVQPSESPVNISVEDAIGDLAQLGRFRTLFDADSLQLSNAQLSRISGAQSDYVRDLNECDESLTNLADPRAWDPRVLTSVGLTIHSEAIKKRFARLAAGERDAVGRLPRLGRSGASPTLRAGTGRDHGSFTASRPVHYARPRVITVREAARLQGFPDWFRFHATKWHGFRQVGNSVPPPLARAVANSIVGVASATPTKRSQQLTLGDPKALERSLAEAARHHELDPAELPINVRAGSHSKAAA